MNPILVSAESMHTAAIREAVAYYSHTSKPMLALAMMRHAIDCHAARASDPVLRYIDKVAHTLGIPPSYLPRPRPPRRLVPTLHRIASNP